MNRIALLLCALLLSNAGSAAEECLVSLHHDIRVSDKLLQVSGNGKPLYQVRQGGVVTVAGAALALNSEQRALADAYAGDVAALITQWARLVTDALEFAGVAVQQALGEAFGADSPAAIEAARVVALAQQRFAHMAQPEDGVYTLTAADFNDPQQELEADDALEEAVGLSIGALFAEMGKAIAEGEGSFADRLQGFGERMERIARGIESMAQTLEETKLALCAEVQEIQQLERAVAAQIPELAGYTLFN